MDNVLSFGSVRLRAPEPEDLELLYEWENDSSLWEMSNARAPLSKHILAQYLQNASRDVYELKQVRMIIETHGHKPVGAVDLYDIDFFHQRAGLGILIHNDADRRQGYASDAIRAIEHYAREVLGIRQVFASVAENNEASIGLFQKAGYALTGIRKKWLNTITGWRDEWFFQKILC